jgi:hypothetical protein
MIIVTAMAATITSMVTTTIITIMVTSTIMITETAV